MKNVLNSLLVIFLLVFALVPGLLFSLLCNYLTFVFVFSLGELSINMFYFIPVFIYPFIFIVVFFIIFYCMRVSWIVRIVCFLFSNKKAFIFWMLVLYLLGSFLLLIVIFEFIRDGENYRLLLSPLIAFIHTLACPTLLLYLLFKNKKFKILLKYHLRDALFYRYISRCF